MKTDLPRHALVAALWAPLFAVAQVAGVTPVSTPSLQYHSAFDGYVPYADIEPGNWRALNDAVKDSDGMAAMPGMQQSAAPSTHGMPDHQSSKPAPTAGPAGRAGGSDKAAAKPGMSGHAHHGMSGAKP